MSRIRKCLLVGHCGADAFALESLVSRACPGLPVFHVSDQATLEREAKSEALLLVNRLLDGSFTCDEGTELMGRLRGLAVEVGIEPATMMLISNFEDAQRAAKEAGGIKGFGKHALHAESTEAYLRQVVGAEGAG